MCAHLLLRDLQNYNSLLNNRQQDNVGYHQEKDTPHPRAKENPQQDGRRGEITFRIKHHTRQRCSDGSNKPCVHQDKRDPTETEPELCMNISCRGTSQLWPAAGAGALGAADLGMT